MTTDPHPAPVGHTPPPALFASYDAAGFFCELTGSTDRPATFADTVRARLEALGIDELRRRQHAVERELYNLGITFTVYAERDAIDRILPFDVVPRTLAADDWAVIEAGVRQRVNALNLFLDDVYHDQKILADGVVPAKLVLGNPNYRPEMVGVEVALRTYVHVCGIDIVRDEAGRPLVLEDNARTPSGVSYVVENRFMMQRILPDLMADLPIRRIDDMGCDWAAQWRRWHHRRMQRRKSYCCRPGSSIRLTSSASFWRAKWARRWSKGAISWSRTIEFT